MVVSDKTGEAGAREQSANPAVPGWHLSLLVATLLTGLCFVTYWPFLDNDFISDEYVFLERVEKWSDDPFYLLNIPPENFRTTTYASFLALKRLFGYRAEWYYVFSILLHSFNGWLLWRLFRSLKGGGRWAFLAAVLFVTAQNPQEAVAWLSGMHELLQATFLLATMILWRENRFLLATLAYSVALVSKESALLGLALIAMLDFWQEGRFRFRPQYAYLVIPTLAFGLLFWAGFSKNSLIEQGLYGVSPRALMVWAKSAHRLAFPWLYLALLLSTPFRKYDDVCRGVLRDEVGEPGGGDARASSTTNDEGTGRNPPPPAGLQQQTSPCLWTGVLSAWRCRFRDLPIPLLWALIALLPYVFLNYQDHIPSRQLYIATMGLAAGLAMLVVRWEISGLRVAFVTAFLVVNIGYIGWVKDAQFQRRGKPTRQLLVTLESRPPGPLVISDFPDNPWIAKLLTHRVPGWDPDMLLVNDPQVSCFSCPHLRWDRQSERYLSQ